MENRAREAATLAATGANATSIEAKGGFVFHLAHARRTT
jgi:hypothetical protein